MHCGTILDPWGRHDQEDHQSSIGILQEAGQPCYSKKFGVFGGNQEESWYSKTMNADVVMYILSYSNINSRDADLKGASFAAKQVGTPWPKQKEEKEFDNLVEKYISQWRVWVPKMLSIINPEYGDFLETCALMHAHCKKEKLSRHAMVGCRLDCSCLFVHATLESKLCCDILTTHCT